MEVSDAKLEMPTLAYRIMLTLSRFGFFLPSHLKKWGESCSYRTKHDSDEPPRTHVCLRHVVNFLSGACI